MNYSETLKYLYAQLPMYQRQGKSAFKKDLTNILKLCELLGNPQEKFKCIHIAGTNGKGTVSHLIANAFQKNGYQTALYTSPHYKDFRERIKIDGKYISRYWVKTFTQKIRKEIQAIEPSFFEITVAMAFDYFAKKKVDIAIIETGLGGRLDSTNIVMPMLSVITNISLEHTNMLGNTLPKIAFEKAGIIKNEIPVVIGKTQKETQKVFKVKAKQCNSNIYFSNEVVKFSKVKTDLQKTKFEIENRSYSTDIAGPFAIENVKTAFAALNIFKKYYPEFSLKLNKAFSNVVKNTTYLGRWNIQQQKPTVLIDSAHNKAALQHLFKFLNTINFTEMHVIIGFVIDKDVDSVLKILPKKAKYYLCEASIPRKFPVADLAKKFKQFNFSTYSTVKKAKLAAMNNAAKNDFVLITGSSFVAAEGI